MKSNKIAGVSLLEIMLVLAIAMVIALTVGRYYKSTQEEMKISKTIDAVHKITEAAAEWEKGSASFAGISMPELTTNTHLLAAEDIANPWQTGDIKLLAAGTTNQQIAITIDALPKDICTNRIKKVLELQNFSVTCNDANAVCTYPAA
jgi:hypothetical protein